jgi:hypothetical protein
MILIDAVEPETMNPSSQIDVIIQRVVAKNCNENQREQEA